MIYETIVSTMMIPLEVPTNLDLWKKGNKFSLFLLLCILALQIEIIVQVCPIDMVRILLIDVFIVCITFM